MISYVDNPFDTPSIISFCPGLRGLERGFERAVGAFHTLAFVEIEAVIIENLVVAMEEGVLASAPIWTNAKTFNALPFRNKVHGIFAGYPCQPFSVAGKREGTDDPRHLYPSISRSIKTARPFYCLFENVPGHLSMGYDTVYKDLRSLGYSVEAGIFSAEEVGAPHERDRLYIFAMEYATKQRLQDGGFAEYWKLYTEERERLFNRPEQSSSSIQAGSGWTYNTPPHMFEKLADSGSDRCEQGGISDGGNDGSIAGADGEQPVPRKLADTPQLRLQGFGAEGQQKSQAHAGKGLPVCGGRGDRWPAPQGIFQYDWEAPRIIESGMGCTINGYNFREDLVRAVGNMVVEQTAEVATIELINAHFGIKSKYNYVKV